MFLEKYLKTTLNVTVQVKSQLLKTDNQYSHYSDYQEYLYNLCSDLKKKSYGYRRISKTLNEMNLLSVRGTEFKSGHIHSLLKKGLIRKNRIKSLKSHKDYETIIKDVYLTFDEL